MLVIVLACAALPPLDSGERSCVDGDDPPGEPIYRHCIIHTDWTQEISDTTTDESGRIVAWTRERNHPTNTGTWQWDGDCLTHATERWFDNEGSPDLTVETTRACDDHGNSTSEVRTNTRWTGGVGASATSRSDTTYTYDDRGRPVVAVTAVEGSTDPPRTRNCAFSDWDSPDACVDVSTEANYSDVVWTWSYDERGLVIAWTVSSQNPGYQGAEERTRDSAGRTATSAFRESSLGSYTTGVYAYDGADLVRIDWTDGGVSIGSHTTHYTYTPL